MLFTNHALFNASLAGISGRRILAHAYLRIPRRLSLCLRNVVLQAKRLGIAMDREERAASLVPPVLEGPRVQQERPSYVAEIAALQEQIARLAGELQTHLTRIGQIQTQLGRLARSRR